MKALQRYDFFYGDTFMAEFPTGKPIISPVNTANSTEVTQSTLDLRKKTSGTFC